MKLSDGVLLVLSYMKSTKAAAIAGIGIVVGLVSLRAIRQRRRPVTDEDSVEAVKSEAKTAKTHASAAAKHAGSAGKHAVKVARQKVDNRDIAIPAR